MPDDTTPAPQRKLTKPEEGVAAMGMIMADSVKQLVITAEAQQTAILAMTALFVLSPGIADVDPKRVAVLIQALTQGRKDADRVRESVAGYVAMVVGMASKLPQIMADAEKAEKAAGGAKGNVKADGGAKGKKPN
jgi:hypothetical protein